VYSFSAGHADAGLFGLYAGCAPQKVEQVEQLMVEQLEVLASELISEAELERGVGQLTGGLVLGLEDSGARMNRLGKAELVTGELVSLTEGIERIRAVTAHDVRELAGELLAQPRSTVRVGPFGA
jgi:predicted Zn-dependent peptidase